MGKRVQMREVTDEERLAVKRLAHSRTGPARAVERARVIQADPGGAGRDDGRADCRPVGAGAQHRVPVAQTVSDARASGVGGCAAWWASADLQPEAGSRKQVGEIVATALTDPQTLDLPFQSWTLDRLVAYLSEQKGITMQRSRVNEVLLTEGLRWRQQETWFGERVDPDFALKRGR